MKKKDKKCYYTMQGEYFSTYSKMYKKFFKNVIEPTIIQDCINEYLMHWFYDTSLMNKSVNISNTLDKILPILR